MFIRAQEDSQRQPSLRKIERKSKHLGAYKRIMASK